MVNLNKKTVVRRIPSRLDDLLNGMRRKNKIKFVEAGDMAADILIANKNKKKVIQKIRREIEF